MVKGRVDSFKDVSPSVPQITTVIPTYKRPHLLKKAILSALKQTFQDLQVIVYDDASNDETEKVVGELMQSDSRLKYQRHPQNIGMMANYDYALKRIETPYFSLLSDDDTLLPVFYETALRRFQEHPNIAFCGCAVRAVDEKGNEVSCPVDLWKRTGYFAPLEGICDMAIYPLLPDGLLFRTEAVKEIQPNLDTRIQIRWDTDYLLQIIEQHPYFIDTTVCALFLAHSQGFSTGAYRQMLQSAEKLPIHLCATEQIIQRLEQSKRLPNPLKKKLVKQLHRSLHKDLCTKLGHYIARKLYKESRTAFKLYFETYGFAIFRPYNLAVFLKHLLLSEKT